MGQQDQVMPLKQREGKDLAPSTHALNVDLNTGIFQSQEVDNLSKDQTVDKYTTRQEMHDHLNGSPRGPRQCNLEDIIILYK